MEDNALIAPLVSNIIGMELSEVIKQIKVLDSIDREHAYQIQRLAELVLNFTTCMEYGLKGVDTEEELEKEAAKSAANRDLLAGKVKLIAFNERLFMKRYSSNVIKLRSIHQML